RNAFAFEVALAGSGKQRFRHETILNTQRIPHCCPEILFNLGGRCHGRKIGAMTPAVKTRAVCRYWDSLGSWGASVPASRLRRSLAPQNGTTTRLPPLLRPGTPGVNLAPVAPVAQLDRASAF